MNADICQNESQIPHPPFFLFCLAHLFYWPGIMVGGATESGSAPRETYAQIFLRYRFFFQGCPLGKPLPGIFALSFIDNFPFTQSYFRGPQIPEIKELRPGPTRGPRRPPGPPAKFQVFQFCQLSPIHM